MRKLSLLLFLVLFLVPVITYGDSGACSGHGGVSCPAGPDYDGSVICNDGWRESSVLYTSMAMCGGSNISHDYSKCDKHRTNSNLPKRLAKAKYDACVRNINSGDYEKEWDRIIQESEAEAQAAKQRFNDELKRMEEEDRRLEEESRRRREEWKRYVEEMSRPSEPVIPNCGPNATVGNDGQCYCDMGFQVNETNNGCVPVICPDGHAVTSEWLCVRTTKQCQKEFGIGAKAKSDGTCIYCEKGFFLNSEWKCEPNKTEVMAVPAKKAEVGTSMTELIDQFEKKDTVEKSDIEKKVDVTAKTPVLDRIMGWIRKVIGKDTRKMIN